jgi:serine O-acetyltransferase
MSALVEDLRHMTAAWDASPSRVLLGSLVKLPLYPRIGAVVTYRASSWCWQHGLRPIALWMQASSIRSSGAEIHPAARLGGGFAIIHTVGIVVGHEVVAGDNLVVYHGVTLGHTGTGQGQPRIGDNVRIGAGAKVLGPVVIGDGAWIGANAVVLGDVPAGGVATGVWRGPTEDPAGGADAPAVTQPRGLTNGM